MAEYMQRVNGHYGQETHPQVVRRDLNVWEITCEEEGYTVAHRGVQKDGRERDTRNG